jgi:hypothetical protein
MALKFGVVWWIRRVFYPRKKGGKEEGSSNGSANGRHTWRRPDGSLWDGILGMIGAGNGRGAKTKKRRDSDPVIPDFPERSSSRNSRRPTGAVTHDEDLPPLSLDDDDDDDPRFQPSSSSSFSSSSPLDALLLSTAKFFSSVSAASFPSSSASSLGSWMTSSSSSSSSRRSKKVAFD